MKGKLKAWNSCSAYEQTVGLSFITLLGTIMKKEIIKNEDLNLYFYNFSEVLFTELWINVKSIQLKFAHAWQNPSCSQTSMPMTIILKLNIIE